MFWRQVSWPAGAVDMVRRTHAHMAYTSEEGRAAPGRWDTPVTQGPPLSPETNRIFVHRF